MEREHDNDAARGMANGLVISTLFWIAIYLFCTWAFFTDELPQPDARQPDYSQQQGART